MNKNLIIIVLLIFFSSCRKEIDILVPEGERRIVFNAMIQPDSLFSANVFMSNHVQDNYIQLLYINNATVNVYDNGKLLETLKIDTVGYYRGSKALAEVGHEYEFVVSANNLETASGKTTTVSKVPIVSIDSTGIADLDYYSNMSAIESDDYTLYSIKFNDNFDTEDFYRIKITFDNSNSIDTFYFDPETNDTVKFSYFPYPPSMQSNDPAIEVMPYQEMYYYLTDKLFNGKEYGFEIGIQVTPEFSGKYIYVYLEHVTSDFYKYVKSVEMQSETNGMEIFYQSVEVFNNIENGLGIIGSTSVTKDSVLLQ